MRLSHYDKERWLEVKDPHHGAIGGKQRSLGEALEAAVRAVTGWPRAGAVEIWECEGHSSYTSTLLLLVERLDNGVLVKEPRK